QSYMVRDGLFDDVDAVLHWHPSSANDASPSSCLAIKQTILNGKGSMVKIEMSEEQAAAISSYVESNIKGK
ncbi:MAG TPA: amidohydrolase, partial [Bacteroidia bacterium]|nr:amidohydrolase [Bacteroidia bacterium]